MREELITPILYSLADALELDLKLDFSERAQGTIHGKRNARMLVFSGYSPLVATEIVDSIVYDALVGVCVRIWGNLHVMCIYESSTLTLFVYDRSKVKKKSRPFSKYWSRKHTYGYLGSCCKGIYSRSAFDTKWEKLDQGTTKLGLYNDMRKAGVDSRTAYAAMWGTE